ncbi:MAG: hypothetical protein ACJA0X_002504, partial [Cyclobacteriaceae bacterium]
DAKEISEDRKASAGFISPLTVLDYKKNNANVGDW